MVTYYRISRYEITAKGDALYRVAIVEDDYIIRNGFGNFFPWKETGFEVAGCFEDGRQALEYMEEHPVELLVSDIRLPVMSGLELAAELYRRKSDVCIVFLSAYDDFSYAQKALEYGVKRYILKSAKFDELVEIFRTVREELDAFHGGSSGAEEPGRFRKLRIESGGNQKIEKLIVFVRSNIREASLQSAADELRMSPVYLSRFFKEKAGHLFNDFLSDERMSTAAQLLRHSEYRIYEIGDLVGYSNAKNFSRAFHRYFGVCPQEFRDGRTDAT